MSFSHSKVAAALRDARELTIEASKMLRIHGSSVVADLRIMALERKLDALIEICLDGEPLVIQKK